MSRNGSGTYNLPAGNPVVPGTVITSNWANTTLNDVAAAITQSLASDGQTVPTANLPMGNFRHINVANAANRTDYAAAGQVQDSSLQWLTSVAGTDTITASLVPAMTAYAAGQSFRFVATGANTTNAVTLNINGIGAKNVTKLGAQMLSAGDIPSGATVNVTYDGTQFQISSIIPARTGFGVRHLLGNNNAGTPTTKLDLSADAVTLLNLTTGESVTRLNTGTLICDLSVAGSAANGRDQAGAFSANSWVHIYFIWNGQTLATLASLTAPPTGPTLPTGYTHWAYATTIRWNGSSNIAPVYIRGSAVNYDSAGVTLLSNGAATTMTTVDCSTAVPPNAVVGLFEFLVSCNHNAVAVFSVNARTFGSSSAGEVVCRVSQQVASIAIWAGNSMPFPLGSQKLDYLISVAPAISGGAFVVANGYVIPNGDA